jgi:hypothetical protein
LQNQFELAGVFPPRLLGQYLLRFFAEQHFALIDFFA